MFCATSFGAVCGVEVLLSSSSESSSQATSSVSFAVAVQLLVSKLVGFDF